MRVSRAVLALVFVSALAAACGDDPTPAKPLPVIDLGDAGSGDADEAVEKERVDGGYLDPSGNVMREDRFVTEVVSFAPGACAGFGASVMPDIVLGPPAGTGRGSGSLDVVSLGIGGEIVVSFGENAIVDAAGPDFVVFENAFFGGSGTEPFADLGEVSVSEDGQTWTTFPCTPGDKAPYGTCAGWRPVFSTPRNGISPLDPAAAGGDAYDLADLGLTKARFVKIRDLGTATCEGQPRPTNLGFDLDAIAILHAATP